MTPTMDPTIIATVCLLVSPSIMPGSDSVLELRGMSVVSVALVTLDFVLEISVEEIESSYINKQHVTKFTLNILLS